MQSGRGEGRDRSRRDHPGSASSGRSNASPSRHLWVGNLSHRIAEQDLTDQFLRFGELESVAFQPGRSYAFINFKNEDDAIVAMKSLQGFPLIGNPLRVEFAKAVSLALFSLFLLISTVFSILYFLVPCEMNFIGFMNVVLTQHYFQNGVNKRKYDKK